MEGKGWCKGLLQWSRPLGRAQTCDKGICITVYIVRRKRTPDSLLHNDLALPVHSQQPPSNICPVPSGRTTPLGIVKNTFKQTVA